MISAEYETSTFPRDRGLVNGERCEIISRAAAPHRAGSAGLPFFLSRCGGIAGRPLAGQAFG
jgi:hypothetical protein